MFLNTYKLNFPDQDVINMLCQGWIRIIGSEYNATHFTIQCIRPKIHHFAAVNNYYDDWVYQKYEAAEMPLKGGENR